MINIVIEDLDGFFKFGLQELLRELFSDNEGEVVFKYQLTSDLIRSADVIFISLCQGESVTCLPELRNRKKGILIGIVEDITRTRVINSCSQDMIFISRTYSLSQIRTAIINERNKTKQIGYYKNTTSCFDCQRRVLSPQQFRIMVGLCQGKSAVRIAEELQINVRTVFTHKYIIMRKFLLRSDYELILLLKRMAPNISRQFSS